MLKPLTNLTPELHFCNLFLFANHQNVSKQAVSKGNNLNKFNYDETSSKQRLILPDFGFFAVFEMNLTSFF